MNVLLSIPCTCFSGVCLSGCVYICVRTCLLVSCMYVRTGECLHAGLFVAGLAPWEPILHLSIPLSRAPILPHIYQRLTLFLSGIIDPIITHTVRFPSLFSDTHTYLYTSCSFTHSGTVTVTPTHICLDRNSRLITKWWRDFGSHMI